MCGSQALTSALEATTAQDLVGGIFAEFRWPGMLQNPSKGCGTVGDPRRSLALERSRCGNGFRGV